LNPLEADREAKIFLAAADCTGHGVPGALVSVVCSNALNRAVKEFGITEPGKILDKVRELVLETFEKSPGDVQDGMDISLAALTLLSPKGEGVRGTIIGSSTTAVATDTSLPSLPAETLVKEGGREGACPTYGAVRVTWAGANNPLWIVRQSTNEPQTPKGALSGATEVSRDALSKTAATTDASLPLGRDSEWVELAPDKQPIGRFDRVKPFTTHTVNLRKGDCIYLFTDGYADQFGGAKGKKFKYKQLQEILLANSDKPMAEQGKILEKTFETWMGFLDQIDDVLVIGIRV
jgi:hypothetical protein